MVAPVFPAAKLGALVIKQISKPLANYMKTKAKSSPFFRTYICMPPAQFYHWCEVRLRMWTMNLGKAVNIPKLSEANAIELGAELVGEGLIFTIAAAIVVVEYTRSSRKEAAKEEDRLAQMAQMQGELKDLYFAKAKSEAQIRELIRVININIPKANIRPEAFDLSSIPDHHREVAEEIPKTSYWNSLVNFSLTAAQTVVDVILPPVDNKSEKANPPPPSTVIVEVVDIKEVSTSSDKKVIVEAPKKS